MEIETTSTIESQDLEVRTGKKFETQPSYIPDSNSQKIISGLPNQFIRISFLLRMIRILFKNYGKYSQAKKVTTGLKELRNNTLGNRRFNKIAFVDGKYYSDLYIPSYGSDAFEDFIEAEANRIIPIQKNVNRFTNVFVAFTKKCPLRCEHCFEWDQLNKKEKLSLADIKKIVAKIQEKGTSQIQLTGGEPLVRIDTIVEILKSANPRTEFWVLSSGFNLTFKNANKLKVGGLTGIVISLDHFNPTLHNQFRGFNKSFEWVLTAVESAISANILVALSLCATKAFVTESNLFEYAELAKKIGVSFIQILEPKAVGHYKGVDVTLSCEQEEVLEDFYLKMNYSKPYKKYPIITYHGYHQRKIGCMASGDRNLYIDTDGNIQACPFCQTNVGNILEDDLDTSIQKLMKVGCELPQIRKDRLINTDA